MNIILLIVAVLLTSLQNVIQKEFNIKVGRGAFVFSSVAVITASLFYIPFIKSGFHFTLMSVLYSILYAMSYSFAVIGTFFAIKTGPMSLSTLLSSFSLIIPSIYGLSFLNEKFATTFLFGFVFIFLSLFFVISYNEKNKKKINIKWMIYVFMVFAGNGFGAVVQKIQQLNCGSGTKAEFMFLSMIISAVVISTLALIFENKNQVLYVVKRGWKYSVTMGIANASVNYLVMVLINTIGVSVVYPVINVGGMLITIIVSFVAYKEKITWIQKIGVMLGAFGIFLITL